MTAIPLITDIATLAQPFDVWFLDIWGVLHNGVRPYPGAVSATQKFRAHGGRVVLVSNSPRPRSGVGRQLDQIGVPPDAYDAILTSGDVSRTLIAARRGSDRVPPGARARSAGLRGARRDARQTR